MNRSWKQLRFFIALSIMLKESTICFFCFFITGAAGFFAENLQHMK